MLPNSISEQIRLFLTKHVKFKDAPPEWTFKSIEVTPSGPQIKEHPFMIGTMLDNTGYTMFLGPVYYDSDDEGKKNMLLHEIAHILRGDCLVNDQSIERDLMNVAADCIINENLPVKWRESLNINWYSKLLKDLDESKFTHELPTTYLPSTKKIYDVLVKKREHDQQCGCGQFGCIIPSPDGTNKDARHNHVKAVLDSKDIEGEVPGGKGYSIDIKGKREKISFKEKALPLLSIIINRLRGISNMGVRKRQRTFIREGRNPFLRGAHDLPRLKLLVALDGSGSCVPYYQKLGAIAKWLSKKHSVDLAAFDTDIEFYRHIDTLKVSGGGTCFQPVWKAGVERKADAIIILTDGEAGDITPLPPMPVVWVMTPGGTTAPLRKGFDTSVGLHSED